MSINRIEKYKGDIPEWLTQESRMINVYLRYGPLTAGEAGKVLGVSMQAAWNLIRGLVEEGMLEVIGKKRPVGHGRSSVVYDVRRAGHLRYRMR
jgi:predicted ArsR family transcriptional regulator